MNRLRRRWRRWRTDAPPDPLTPEMERAWWWLQLIRAVYGDTIDDAVREQFEAFEQDIEQGRMLIRKRRES